MPYPPAPGEDSLHARLRTAFTADDEEVIRVTRSSARKDTLRVVSGAWEYGRRLYVPLGVKPGILRMAHDLPSAAHLGQRKMIAWLMRLYWGPRDMQASEARMVRTLGEAEIRLTQEIRRTDTRAMLCRISQV